MPCAKNLPGHSLAVTVPLSDRLVWDVAYVTVQRTQMQASTRRAAKHRAEHRQSEALQDVKTEISRSMVHKKPPKPDWGTADTKLGMHRESQVMLISG